MLDNRIVIIDYKMGNLRSVEKAFEKIGANVIVSNNHKIIETSDKIVLPGVGAFRDGMKHLKELNLIEVLNNEVLNRKKPFLGICLGMQLIGTKSYEVKETKGLDWIESEIVKFDFSGNDIKLKVPHVGWNNVYLTNNNPLFGDIEDESDFYFVHSFHFETDHKYVIGKSDYGFEFVSSVQKENIYACQFHPEKSQHDGLQLLKNFANMELE